MRNTISRILLVTLLVTLAAFGLFGCQEDNTKSSTPIAVIDQTKIFEKSTNIKAAREHGDTFLEKLNQEMVVLKELAEKEKDKKKAQAMIEEGTLEIQQRLQAEDYLITTKISALFEGAVKEVKDEIGATVVMSADLLMSYDEKVDITDLIVAKIDKTPLSFADEPVTGEDAATDTETDAATATEDKAAVEAADEVTDNTTADKETAKEAAKDDDAKAKADDADKKADVEKKADTAEKTDKKAAN